MCLFFFALKLQDQLDWFGAAWIFSSLQLCLWTHMHSLTTAGKGHLCGLLFFSSYRTETLKKTLKCKTALDSHTFSLFLYLSQRQATQKDGDSHFPVTTVPWALVKMALCKATTGITAKPHSLTWRERERERDSAKKAALENTTKTTGEWGDCQLAHAFHTYV